MTVNERDRKAGAAETPAGPPEKHERQQDPVEVPEQVTTAPTFDGFPMFSLDGKKLVWASNRHDANPHETNIFIADWVN